MSTYGRWHSCWYLSVSWGQLHCMLPEQCNPSNRTDVPRHCILHPVAILLTVLTGQITGHRWCFTDLDTVNIVGYTHGSSTVLFLCADKADSSSIELVTDLMSNCPKTLPTGQQMLPWLWCSVACCGEGPIGHVSLCPRLWDALHPFILSKNSAIILKLKALIIEFWVLCQEVN